MGQAGRLPYLVERAEDIVAVVNVNQRANQRLFQDEVLAAIADGLEEEPDGFLVAQTPEAFCSSSGCLRVCVILGFPVRGERLDESGTIFRARIPGCAGQSRGCALPGEVRCLHQPDIRRMARLCGQLRPPFLADAVNRPEDIWLGEPRAGT